MTDTEREALCARIDELCAENEKLRRENRRLQDRGVRLFDKTLKLGTESDKLRELVRGLLTGYECGYGELCEGCSWSGFDDPKTFPCRPRVMARELGVEA